MAISVGVVDCVSTCACKAKVKASAFNKKIVFFINNVLADFKLVNNE